MLLVGEGAQVDRLVRGPVAALLQRLKHRVVEIVGARVGAVVAEPAADASTTACQARLQGDGAGVVRQHQASGRFLGNAVH